jgi:hypothetical protein
MGFNTELLMTFMEFQPIYREWYSAEVWMLMFHEVTALRWRSSWSAMNYVAAYYQGELISRRSYAIGRCFSVTKLHFSSKRLCGPLLMNGEQINLDEMTSPSISTSFLGHNTIVRINEVLCQRVAVREYDIFQSLRLWPVWNWIHVSQPSFIRI